MLSNRCVANLRQDPTSHRANITLPQRGWSIIKAKQERLAAERGVPNVSRPVALMELLNEYEKTIVLAQRLLETLNISPQDIETQLSIPGLHPSYDPNSVHEQGYEFAGYAYPLPTS